MAERRSIVWVVPRPWLDAHPLLGGLAVVAFCGSAAAYGVLACPSSAVTVGLAGAAYAGLTNFGTSGHPGCLARACFWVTSGRRGRQHRMAPYMWRWGAICAVVGAGSLALGGGIACR